MRLIPTTSFSKLLRQAVLIFAEAESSRLTTVLQENAVLRSELEVMRLRCKNLVEENRKLRQASVTIVSAEREREREREEEEFHMYVANGLHFSPDRGCSMRGIQ